MKMQLLYQEVHSSRLGSLCRQPEVQHRLTRIGLTVLGILAVRSVDKQGVGSGPQAGYWHTVPVKDHDEPLYFKNFSYPQSNDDEPTLNRPHKQQDKPCMQVRDPVYAGRCQY